MERKKKEWPNNDDNKGMPFILDPEKARERKIRKKEIFV